jgi:hypothetical protein
VARDGFTSIATSTRIVGRHVSTVLHHRFGIPTHKDSERLHRERMLPPPAGSQPLSGWAQGTLSVPGGSGTPAYKLQVKTTTPAYRLRAAPGPPRAPAAWGSTGAATCHLGSSTHLLAQGSSGAATCHLDSAGCKQINKYPLATRPS